MGRLSKLLGEVSKLLGEVSKLLGEVSKLLGEVSKLLGAVSKLLGEFSKLLGEVSKLLILLELSKLSLGKCSRVLSNILPSLQKEEVLGCKFMSCSHCQELCQLADLASDWLLTLVQPIRSQLAC